MRANPKNTNNGLPPPTASEAAFERAFAALLDPRDAFVESVFSRKAEFLNDEYATLGDASQFHTKLAGVSFEARQAVIGTLAPDAQLRIEREPDNEHDPNAIAVFYGQLQLGFLNRRMANRLAPIIDAGRRYRARVASITGGGDRSYGVNIFVWRDEQTEDRPDRRASRARSSADEALVRRALIGESALHDAQRHAIARVRERRNTLLVMGTGRGKSLCFQLPAAVWALESQRKTIVVYPLRALANDQHAALVRKLEPLGLRIFRANGSIDADERAALFDALHTGAWDLILATPEFLDYHRAEFADASRPDLLVVDEAHHLFESRHRASYARFGEIVAALGDPKLLALTATADDEAFEFLRRTLAIESWVIDPTVRENLHVIDARNTRAKGEYLHDLFRGGDRGIVYCNSRREATSVADDLRKKIGNTVMFYHAGMPVADRLQTERLFRENALDVIVATSAFGEGIDLPDVRHVVLYHLNFDFTEFNQQAGRAGRDGAEAHIHLLFGEQDRGINEFIIDREAPTLAVLRALYRGIRGLAHDGILRQTYVDIARTLELDKVNERTVSRALAIFADEGLVEIGEDDDGRYVRFQTVDAKVDMTQNERFAEGEAEREDFKRFCELVLTAKPNTLERIINRPIYPERIALVS